MSKTKFILLGAGTPRYNPGQAQQSSAIIVDEQAYLIDCGDGAMLRIAEAIGRGIEALAFTKLTHLFLTHLHPDHTAGLPGLIIGPWVMRRSAPLHIYGPKGSQALVDGILAAYETGIAAHRAGLAPLNHPLAVEVHEYMTGEIYQDDQVTVTAFPVDHSVMEAYGLKFVTADKVIVHSGDTCPVASLVEHARGCDILVHEVYFRQSLLDYFPPAWQTYHRTVHTSEVELAAIANEVQPKRLILNHQMIWGAYTAEALMESLTSRYKGEVIYGRDLDLFE
jgi:ribonuclease BN (tRNA processing enzyme)